MQNLGKMLAVINAGEVANKKSKEEKKEPTFHMKEMARMNAHPPEMAKAAANVGRKKAEAFLQSVRDPKDKDHDRSLAIFQDKFHSSETEVENDFVAKTIREYDCHPAELRDIAFEQKTLNACRPTGNITKTDVAHHQILTDALNAEWTANGYKNSQSIIDGHKAKYGK